MTAVSAYGILRVVESSEKIAAARRHHLGLPCQRKELGSLPVSELDQPFLRHGGLAAKLATRPGVLKAR